MGSESITRKGQADQGTSILTKVAPADSQEPKSLPTGNLSQKVGLSNPVGIS